MRRFVGGIVLAALAVDAGAGLKIEDYDVDDDQTIDVGEFERFIKDHCSPSVSSFDRNHNGKIEAVEVDEINKALASLEDCAGELAGFHDSYGETGRAIAEVARHYLTEDVKEYGLAKLLPKVGAVVRETYEELGFGVKPKVKEKAKGAQFAITGDKNKGNTTLTIKGAVMRPVRWGAHRVFLPGLEFNRIKTGADANKSVNTLTFRAGLHFEHLRKRQDGGKLPLVQSVYSRVNPLVTTSFDFDVDVRGIEVQLEPVMTGVGFGASNGVGPLEYLGRVTLQVEFGRVFDAGGRVDLVEGETFGRLGPRFSVRVWPRAHDRLVTSLSYEYLERLSADTRARKLFKAAISYDLDADGALKFETKYTNGDSSVALENEETWTVGVALKI